MPLPEMDSATPSLASGKSVRLLALALCLAACTAFAATAEKPYAVYCDHIAGQSKKSRLHIENPHDLCFDSQTNLFVADDTHIIKIDPRGYASVYAGVTSGAVAAPPEEGPRLKVPVRPFTLCIDSHGVLYFSELYRIRKILPDGQVRNWVNFDVEKSQTRPPDSRPRGKKSLEDLLQEAKRTEDFPAVWNMRMDAADNLFALDTQFQRLLKIDPAGKITVVGTNSLPGREDSWTGLCLDAHGNATVGTSQGLINIAPSGRVSEHPARRTGKGLRFLHEWIAGLCTDAGGNIFSGGSYGTIDVAKPDGLLFTPFEELPGCESLCFHPSGDLIFGEGDTIFRIPRDTLQSKLTPKPKAAKKKK